MWLNLVQIEGNKEMALHLPHKPVLKLSTVNCRQVKVWITFFGFIPFFAGLV